MKSPNSLGKTIEAKAFNRPVKIAYLVPFNDVPQTHMNLDAVFFESYTRWSGVYTLVIPTNTKEFLNDGHNEWLKHYDPDFIYSYVDLDTTLIERIDHLCCPIAFLKHRIRNSEDSEVDWRTFLPRWGHYIEPVSSISTVSSPASYPHNFNEERPLEPTVFTQLATNPYNRFLADNFGTSFSLNNVTHAVPGFYKTLCLTPPDLPSHTIAGTERCSTLLEALRAISDRKASTIARYAMLHSTGMPRAESANWRGSFRLFVGNTPLDRINFWNSRHLGDSWSDTPNALVLEPAFFEDEALVVQLGQYLNKNNFLSRGNGPYQTAIHSSSMSAEVLYSIRDKLKPHTWTEVSVSKSFNAFAVPQQNDLADLISTNSNDSTTLKLTEDSNEIIASEPAHFIYLPPHLKNHSYGQWIVELNIQRHNDLSPYFNVIDTWVLPRRHKIVRAFTRRLAKPTLSGQLALIPSREDFPFQRHRIKNPRTYEIFLPSDEAFFRHLSLDILPYDIYDMRAALPRKGYKDLIISDKGQNLRGVISLFGHLSTAFEILTNKFWRTVLAAAKEDSSKPLTFDRDKLDSFVPNDRKILEQFRDRLRLDSTSKTRQYICASLTDTLEHLVRLSVFYQVANWRCQYCGHSNTRSFDDMRIKNSCDICSTDYFAAIDIEWQYELNGFIYRSLYKHSGLTVLWVLGFLQDQMHSGSFWYLPEVDLHENDDTKSKNEVDVLAMVDGKFYAVEAKLCASTFLNKPGSTEKLIKLIGLLRPDVILLAFEKLCPEKKDEEATRARLDEECKTIRGLISSQTKLEVIVAQDVPGFNDFPINLGWYGPRVNKYHR